MGSQQHCHCHRLSQKSKFIACLVSQEKSAQSQTEGLEWSTFNRSESTSSLPSGLWYIQPMNTNTSTMNTQSRNNFQKSGNFKRNHGNHLFVPRQDNSGNASPDIINRNDQYPIAMPDHLLYIKLYRTSSYVSLHLHKATCSSREKVFNNYSISSLSLHSHNK